MSHENDLKFNGQGEEEMLNTYGQSHVDHYVTEYRSSFLEGKLREIENRISGRDRSFLPMITDENGNISEDKVNKFITELEEARDGVTHTLALNKDLKFLRSFLYCSIMGINPNTNQRNKTFADIIDIASSISQSAHLKVNNYLGASLQTERCFLKKTNGSLSLAIGFFMPELCLGLSDKGERFFPEPQYKNILMRNDSGECVDTVKSYNKENCCFNSLDYPIYAEYMDLDDWYAANPEKFARYYEELQHYYFEADRRLLADDLITLINQKIDDGDFIAIYTKRKYEEYDDCLDQSLDEFVDYIIKEIDALGNEHTPVQKEYARRFLYCAIDGYSDPDVLYDIWRLAKEVADAPFTSTEELMQHAYNAHGTMLYYKDRADFFELMDKLYLKLTGNYIFSMSSNEQLSRFMKQYCEKTKKALIHQSKHTSILRLTLDRADYEAYLRACEKFGEEPQFKNREEYQEYQDCREFADPLFDSFDIAVIKSGLEFSYNDYEKRCNLSQPFNNLLPEEFEYYMSNILQWYDEKVCWLENLVSPYNFFVNYLKMFALCDEISLIEFDKIIRDTIDYYLFDKKLSGFCDVNVFSEYIYTLSKAEKSINRIKRKEDSV